MKRSELKSIIKSIVLESLQAPLIRSRKTSAVINVGKIPDVEVNIEYNADVEDHSFPFTQGSHSGIQNKGQTSTTADDVRVTVAKDVRLGNKVLKAGVEIPQHRIDDEGNKRIDAAIAEDLSKPADH